MDLFVFDGSNGPRGPNHARINENQAREAPVEVAANSAIDVRRERPARTGRLRFRGSIICE